MPLNIEELKTFYARALAHPREFLNKALEGTVTRLYGHILRAGSIAVDIGASVGDHTLPMARLVGSQGSVISFEPIQNCFDEVSRKVKLAGVQDQVRLHNMALSNYEGESEYFVVRNLPGTSGLKRMPHQDIKSRERVTVRVARLDDVIHDKVDFIKVDAEGGDFFAIQGARRILMQSRPVVAFESGEIPAAAARAYGYTREDFLGFFEETNYNLYNVCGLPFEPEFWENTNTLWDTIALPVERESELRDLLWLSVLEGHYDGIDGTMRATPALLRRARGLSGRLLHRFLGSRS